MSDAIHQSWYKLLFAVRRSIRYHNYRRRFFDNLRMWMDFLTIISGGGVIITSKASCVESWWVIGFGAAGSILAALNLVLGFSIRARDHFDLSKRFTKLEQYMNKVGDTPTADELKEATNIRLEIESDEPPALRTLDLWCHNELCIAEGHEKSERYKLSLLQRFWKQWFSYGTDDLEKMD